MEDTSLPMEAAPAATPDPPRSVAPWWHTAAILLLIGVWAALSGTRKHSYAETSHPITYLSMIMMSWMLFGSVVAGITDRRAFFFATLRNKAHSFWVDVASGFAVYVGIYFTAVAIVMVFVMATMLHSFHVPTPHEIKPPAHSSTQSVGPRASTPVPPPAPTAPESFDSLAKSRFNFDTKTVLELAPSKPLDLLLWIAISCTAGFCEEHIFRGYLLKQAIALTEYIGMSHLFASALSILVTSLIFGSLHLYEGVGGALAITVLGAIYSVIALKLGNLRAVIVAHFLQDFVAGLFLFLFHARLMQ